MVVDASVWVSALVPEDEHHLPSRQWLRQHVEAGGLLAGPTMLLAEVAGAIARRTGVPDLGIEAAETILHTPGLRLVTLDLVGGHAAARSAARFRLRGADAIYAEVARALGVPVITWDREIHDRASGLVTVLTP